MKNLLILLFFAAICTASGINVRDFGAVGDGKTDDTAAIQKAVFYLSDRIKYDRFRLEDNWNKGSTETHVEELFFPKGTYKISNTIFAHGSVVWRGEKGTRIVQDDFTKDILYCRIYRRAIFNNIEFSGGRTQIQLWSRNWNASSVHIRNCVFRDSAAAAVRSVSMRIYAPPEDYSKSWSKQNIIQVPPHEVTIKNGVPILTPPPIRQLISWFSSNIIYICKSEFINCIQPFEFNNDGTLLDQCRIVANPDTKGPIIHVGIGPAPNMLAIWNLQAEAPATKNKQYWFENIGYHFSCNDSTFRSVNPMPILDQNTGKVPGHSIPGSVTFNRCTFDSPEPPEALIILRRLPCVLKMIDNINVNGSVPMIKWMFTPDQKYFERDSFQGKLRGIPWSVPHKYNVIVHGNKNIQNNMLKIMDRFTYPDDPMLHASVPAMPKAVPAPAAEIFAADFGVVGDGKTDNSAALSKALAAAARARKTLVIPSGRVRLAATVKLPDFVSMRGEGMPVIYGDKRDAYDLFTAENPETVIFTALIMRQGKRFLNVKLGPQSRMIGIYDCLFYESSPYSIVAKGKNNCFFQATGSLWNGAGGVFSDCTGNEVVMCWMANNFFMDDQAFFTVRKGTLLMRSPFFVPYVSKGIKRTNRVTKETKIWELGGNLRWVDNAGGNVYMHTPRGGGEAGGYSMLHQTAPGGKVYIEGGLARFTNKDTRHDLFYAAAAPDKAVFTGISGNPIRPFLGINQKVWSKAPGVKNFPIAILGVMNPQPEQP